MAKKAPRIVRYTRADGTVKEYRYARNKPRAPKPDTIDALLTAYRSSPEWSALAKTTRATYMIYLKELEKVGGVLVADVTRRDVRVVLDRMTATRGAAAAAYFVKVTSMLLSWAVERDWIPFNPLARMKLPRGGSLPAWLWEEADEAQAKLPEHLRRVVVLARYTGQRRGDLIAMTWRAFDGTTIRVRQQKTGEELVIPCHPVLRMELLRWKAEARSLTILTNMLGQPWTPQHLSHSLPKSLRRIGLRDRINVHGLRKLAAASLAEAGCSTHEIMAITGHRTLAMVDHYTRSANQRRLANAAIVRLSSDKTRQNQT